MGETNPEREDEESACTKPEIVLLVSPIELGLCFFPGEVGSQTITDDEEGSDFQRHKKVGWDRDRSHRIAEAEGYPDDDREAEQPADRRGEKRADTGDAHDDRQQFEFLSKITHVSLLWFSVQYDRFPSMSTKKKPPGLRRLFCRQGRYGYSEGEPLAGVDADDGDDEEKDQDADQDRAIVVLRALNEVPAEVHAAAGVNRVLRICTELRHAPIIETPAVATSRTALCHGHFHSS